MKFIRFVKDRPAAKRQTVEFETLKESMFTIMNMIQITGVA